MIKKHSNNPVFLMICTMIMFLSAFSSTVPAEEMAVLKGRITDVEDRVIVGARVFVYDDADVRRPANFISAPTDNKGEFRMVLTPGKYWIVARFKKSEEFGPLMPGDKHSGEPVVLEFTPGHEADANFTVADLKDARRIRAKDQERPVKISGRIIDEKGTPVTKAYAIALKSERTADIPDYLSAWVDNEGNYTLYLPRGKYFIGSAVTFPPGQNYFIQGELSVDTDASAVDIVMKSRAGK